MGLEVPMSRRIGETWGTQFVGNLRKWQPGSSSGALSSYGDVYP
jgi:hypothetical protein